MAKKEEAKIVAERTYNIPLRKDWLKKPFYKRAKKAVSSAREFLIRHMKSEDIRLGPWLNRKIWEHGMRNPPHHIKVIAKKDDKGIVFAELAGVPVEKEEQKAEKKAKPAEKEQKKEEPKEEKKPEKPKEENKEIKEGQQEKK